MSSASWGPIVQWTLWGLTMTVVMGWIARSRLRKRPESERYTLVHPVSTLLIGLVGAAFFFGIAVISNTVGKNPTATIWTTLAFVAFGLASVPMIADYYLARHRVSAQGIEYGRMFGQRGTMNWSEVKAVKFAPVMKWFVLESSTGTKVRVSAMLLGLPEFARLVVLHVSPAAIDSKSKVILLETEQGKPPNVWG
jgi:hypothetical protein